MYFIELSVKDVFHGQSIFNNLKLSSILWFTASLCWQHISKRANFSNISLLSDVCLHLLILFAPQYPSTMSIYCQFLESRTNQNCFSMTYADQSVIKYMLQGCNNMNSRQINKNICFKTNLNRKETLGRHNIPLRSYTLLPIINWFCTILDWDFHWLELRKPCAVLSTAYCVLYILFIYV